MTSVPDQPQPRLPDEDVPTEELARQQGITPISSIEDLKALAQPDAWESDQEFDEFLADLYASRHAHGG